MGMMSDYQFEVKYPKHWVLQHLQGLTQRLHATHAHFHDPQLGLEVLWSSRRHRKGRRVEVEGEPGGPRVRRHWPTLWGFEFGNISWWVAQFFTWGSAVWCVNGWYSLFPLSNETINGNIVGWTALVGGTLFEAGAYCMVVEALNRGHTVRFGYEVTKTLRASVHHLEADVRYLEEAAGSGMYSLFELADKLLPEGGHESSHHASADGAGPGSNGQPLADRDDARRNRSAERVAGREWQWWGYRWRDLGYLASFITFIGATTFWVSTITGVPGVLPNEATHIAEWDILFWLPQVLGSCCFITASILFMLEVQQSWWRIEPFNLGWHVGFWNFVGGVGFWLCGFFGFFAYPAGQYQRWGTNCSTFWGAWAFLLGSYIQLVEMLN